MITDGNRPLLFPVHSYDVDLHFWDVLLKDIWQRKQARGLKFLEPTTTFDTSPTVGATAEDIGGFGEDDVYDDDDDVLDNGAPDGVGGSDDAGSDVDSNVEAMDQNGAPDEPTQGADHEETAPVIQPVVTGAPEQLMNRGGGGSTWKPDTIIKHDGTEHTVGENKYV